MIHPDKRNYTSEIGVHCFKFQVTTGHLDLEIGLSDNINNLPNTVLAIEPEYFTWGFILRKKNAVEIGVNCFKFEVTTGHLDLKIGPSDIFNNQQATALELESKWFTLGFILGRGGTLLKLV